MKCRICGKEISEAVLNERFNKHVNRAIAFCSVEHRDIFDQQNMDTLKATMKEKFK